MNAGNPALIAVGISAIAAGSTVLAAMVRYDLGSGSRLRRGGQWLLATALGTGILAFTLKLGLIALMADRPDMLIDPLISRPQPAAATAPVDPLYGAFDSRRYAWQALPASRDPLPAVAYRWEALPERAPAPPDNPTTAAKVALGERLFFDPALSRDGTLACSSCHDVRGGSGADGLPTSRGIDGQTGARNAPTVWNAAFQSVLFWDGRAASLEEQATGPLVNPVEMGMPSLADVEARVRASPDYRDAFAEAFGDHGPVTIGRIAQALAAYERTLITPDAPYDRFVRGDLEALTPAQLRGMALFQSLGCVTCHSGPNFSGASLFGTPAPMRTFPLYPTPYQEQYRLLRDKGAAAPESGRGSWRIPSLRNVALTGPWFHNGAVSDLSDAVRIMAAAQLGRSGPVLVWSDRNKVLVELDRPTLADEEVNDLVAFLESLSSEALAARTDGAP